MLYRRPHFKKRARSSVLCTGQTIFILLLLTVSTLNAKNNDSLDHAKPTSIGYTIGDNEDQVYPIDTTLEQFHYYDPVNAAGFSYRSIGNFGAAHFPFVYKPSTDFGFNLGFRQLDLYRFTRQNIPYFNNQGSPYTHLLLLIGMRKEQVTEVTHSQPIRRQSSFGFHYKRFATDGAYTNQRTRHNDFALTFRFKGKKERYHLKTLFLMNNLKAEENGGVRETDIFEDTSFLRKDLVGVELTQAENRRNDIQYLMRQSWSWGETVTKVINDSTSEELFYPTMQFYHEAGVGREKFEYDDNDPDSSYYALYFPVTENSSSLSSNLKHIKPETSVGIQKAFLKTDSTYRNVRFHASGHYVFHILDQNDLANEWLHELTVKLQISSNPKTESRLSYNFSGAYSLLDYNKNDFTLQAGGAYDFEKYGVVSLMAGYEQVQPDWIFKQYQLSDISWENHLKKTTNTVIGLSYRLPKYHFHVSGKFYNVKNLAYWDNMRLPNQHRDHEQVLVLELRKLFTIKGFGFDNLIRIHLNSDDNFLRYPLYWSIHSLFYEDDLFKGVLRTRVGLDIYYNTDYDAPGYFPLISQFYLQDEEQPVFYPVMDFYLNLQVKSVRIFFKLKHLNQGMFKRNGYFNAYKYPSQERSFRIGISWKFFD